MTIKGVLFDKDGTLIDFDGTWGPAAYEVMRVLSRGDAGRFRALVEVSEYVLEERRFRPTSPLVAGSSASYGPLWAAALGRPAGPELYEEMDDLFRSFGLRSLAPIHRPLDVARALAARGLSLGIATNDAESSARAQADAMGLTPLMAYIAGYDSGYGAKPGPGMVTGFVELIGAKPAEVLMVGDSLHDLHAARAAGAVAVAVLTGPTGEGARRELGPHADHVLGSIAELPALADHLAAKAAPSLSPSA
jgi:phosphoglycolate phosphatase